MRILQHADTKFFSVQRLSKKRPKLKFQLFRIPEAHTLYENGLFACKTILESLYRTKEGPLFYVKFRIFLVYFRMKTVVNASLYPKIINNLKISHTKKRKEEINIDYCIFQQLHIYQTLYESSEICMSEFTKPQQRFDSREFLDSKNLFE